MPDFSNIRYFVAFVGSARSGTTLVRCLLDAHSRVIIGNEVNVLRHLKNGRCWRWVLKRIVENSQAFLANPVHTDFEYRVPVSDPGQKERIEIIGDKKAGVSTVFFQEEPELLNEFLDWVEVPVRFIHCVRHPLDVIATKKRRQKADGRDRPVSEIVGTHFTLHRTVDRLFGSLDPEQCMRVYHEDLVMAPRSELIDLMRFLELTCDERYLDACESVVNAEPHLSRHSIEWPAGAVALVEREMQECGHLHRYMDHGRLLFDPIASA